MLSEPIIRSTSGDVGDDGHTMFGYAAMFDTVTEINSWEGSFEEYFSRGTFTSTLRRDPTPVVQFDHGFDSRVGSVPIAALESLTQDQVGLYLVARLFENDAVEPVRQAIAAHSITGQSIRFQVVRDEWRDSSGKKISDNDELVELLWNPNSRGPLRRNIKEAKLIELGPVVFPAYRSTSVDVRAGIVGMSRAEIQQRRERIAPQRFQIR